MVRAPHLEDAYTSQDRVLPAVLEQSHAYTGYSAEDGPENQLIVPCFVHHQDCVLGGVQEHGEGVSCLCLQWKFEDLNARIVCNQLADTGLLVDGRLSESGLSQCIAQLSQVQPHKSLLRIFRCLTNNL